MSENLQVTVLSPQKDVGKISSRRWDCGHLHCLLRNGISLFAFPEPRPNPVVKILSKARREWFGYMQLVISPTISLPFRAYEESGVLPVLIEALSEVELMGDEQHFDGRIQQTVDDLAANF